MSSLDPSNLLDPQGLWRAALEVWVAGSWAMVAIAIIALVMFTVGLRVMLELAYKLFTRPPEDTWRRWIDKPRERQGTVGGVLDFVMSARTVKHMRVSFDELRGVEVRPFARDLRVMRVCVSAAPLVGLLGTVTGMLSTFGALASGSGGDETMGMVAEGISEALVTTETGLVVALAGLFFQYVLTRLHARYEAFLAHVETLCTQKLHKGQRGARKAELRRAAALAIARRLRERLSGEASAPPPPAPAAPIHEPTAVGAHPAQT